MFVYQKGNTINMVFSGDPTDTPDIVVGEVNNAGAIVVDGRNLAAAAAMMGDEAGEEKAID